MTRPVLYLIASCLSVVLLAGTAGADELKIVEARLDSTLTAAVPPGQDLPDVVTAIDRNTWGHVKGSTDR